MRNCMLGCVVLIAMAGTALGETKEPPPLAVAPFDAAKAKEHQEAWAKHIGQPREVTNSIGMKLTLVPPGEFMMGNGESAEETSVVFNKSYGEDLLNAAFFEDEHPQHRVRITKPFYLGTYHVTRGQFRQFVEDSGYKNGETFWGWGWNPDTKAFGLSGKHSWRNVGFEQTDEHPTVLVSWNDAVAFCKWLSKKDRKTYRLPTEAEWEYACRAGTTTRYSSGDDPETLAQVGNVADAALKAKISDWRCTFKASDGYAFTAPVGKFKSNAFGLYDMHGNVWQWCSDWYGADYYAASLADDPNGPDFGDARVLRGGSWDVSPIHTRSAKRGGFSPDNENFSIGFRVCQDSVGNWRSSEPGSQAAPVKPVLLQPRLLRCQRLAAIRKRSPHTTAHRPHIGHQRPCWSGSTCDAREMAGLPSATSSMSSL